MRISFIGTGGSSITSTVQLPSYFKGEDGINGGPVRPVVTKKNFSKVFGVWLWFDWYGVGTTDTVVESDNSIVTRITPSVENLAGVGYDLTTLSATDLSKQNLRIKIYCNNWEDVENLSIIALDATSNAIFNTSILDNIQKINGEWIELVIPRGKLHDGASSQLTNVKFLLVRVDGVAGKTPTVKLKEAALITDSKKPVASIVFDDSYSSVYSVAKPIMDQRGLAGTLYTIPDAIGTTGYITATQEEALHQSGWDISGHHQTNLSTMTSAERQAALKNVANYLRQRGYRGAEHFAYPNGVFNNEIVRDVRKYFGTARTINWMFQPRNYIDEMRINSISVSNVSTPSMVLGMVDKAIEEGAWVVITFHKIATTAVEEIEYSTTNFTEIVEGLIARGIDILPVSQALYAQNIPKDGEPGAAGADGSSVTVRTYTVLADAEAAQIAYPNDIIILKDA